MFGLHEPGGGHLIKGVGYIVYTHELGADPNVHTSYNYPLPHIAIARLNHGYGKAGTIPTKDKYIPFSIRVGNWVKNSTGCSRWVIGNETNLKRERPGGQAISAKDYSECFLLCREQILAIPGHEHDEVIPAAVGPWNVETGDWLLYFVEVQQRCMPNALALHTYSRGSDPQSIFSNDKMNPPYDDRFVGFRAYRDFMSAVLEDLIAVPVYITETNQNGPWANVNSGWVQNAYQEIKDWNSSHYQQIKALVLYRWPKYDEYYIEGKTRVHEDFLQAQETKMQTVYQTSFEEGFYDYNNIGELTCPNGWTPDWLETGVRPEYDAKDKQAGHPEVRTGRYAANFFHLYSQWEGYLIKKFLLTPGVDFQATIYCMGVHDKPGGAGMLMRAITKEQIYESAWWSTYMSEYQDRVWRQLAVSGKAGPDGVVEIVLLGKTDVAISWHTHWDDFVLMADEKTPTPDPEPPIEGNHILRLRADIDGVSVLDESIPLKVEVSGTKIVKAPTGLVASLLARLR